MEENKKDLEENTVNENMEKREAEMNQTGAENVQVQSAKTGDAEADIAEAVDAEVKNAATENVETDSGKTASSKEGPVLVNKMSLIFRIVVGGYLLYTAYSLVPAIQNDTSNQKIFFALFTVLFIAVGGFLAIKSIQSLIYGRYIGGPADPATQEAAEEAGETTVTAEARVEEEEAGIEGKVNSKEEKPL